jgi:hypothetical protein
MALGPVFTMVAVVKQLCGLYIHSNDGFTNIHKGEQRYLNINESSYTESATNFFLNQSQPNFV